VVLPLAESVHAADVAAKILKALEPPFEIEGLPIVTEASIGIAVCPDHGESADLIMQRADVAMYRTKQTGGYVIYDPQFDHHSPRRLALLGELRHAIEHDELMLFYQPKVAFQTRSVVGVEALVRWNHPYRGVIPPDQFVGPAEQTGLIKPLTLWVIQHAQRQAAAWAEAGMDLPVSVNLSARQMHDTEFPSRLADVLRNSGYLPERLELEITESAIMVDPERALQTIHQLKALGLRLSIDDFGTGYSSLVYLKSLPVETIKIDKSFVMNMPHSANDVAIVRSTIEMAHGIGLNVVAEGIESEAVWNLLSGMECDVAQGYFLSKPLPADHMTRWLRESRWGFKAVRP
jgi:EAL domain-containing protein (putative c-di-GMP-specific phosphodiesterase class I)